MPTFWACAQTHPRQEDIALKNLRRQNYTAFFPFFMLQKTKYGRPHGQYLAKPAFPGYVFIELEDDVHNWAPINFTLGIRRLITYTESNDKEAYRFPSRADFIAGLHGIRILRADKGPDLIPPGTMVKIKKGPFAERVALVSMSTAERVSLVMEVFNRHLTLEFDVAAVERIMRPVA